MSISSNRNKDLQKQCNQFRIDLIYQLHAIQTGHPGGSLSSVEIITKLYDEMKIDPNNPDLDTRDRFILGKGHAAPILYLVLASKGFFEKEEMKTLRQINSRLQGHPCSKTTPGIEASTGPLGLGLSMGVGMSLGAKLNKSDNTVYVLMGDGEIQEGIVWEAAMSASKYQLDNLIAVLDNNGVQLDGTVNDIMPMLDITSKWKSFGWHVIEVDGHDLDDLDRALEEAKKVVGQPTLINAKTIKGKGISFMEGKNIWHGKPIDKEHYKMAISELGGEVDGI